MRPFWVGCWAGGCGDEFLADVFIYVGVGVGQDLMQAGFSSFPATTNGNPVVHRMTNSIRRCVATSLLI